MPIVITESFEIPAHWMVALIYDDYSGMSDAEERQIDAFMDGMLDQFQCFEVQAPTGEPYFSTFHVARDYGVLACDVYEVDVIVDVQE